MVYKSLDGLAPDYVKSMFTDRSVMSTYSLRNCEGKLAVPLRALDQFSKKSSFSYSGAVLSVQQLTYQSVASTNSSPSGETPLGPGAKNDDCFCRLAQTLASFKFGCRAFLLIMNQLISRSPGIYGKQAFSYCHYFCCYQI